MSSQSDRVDTILRQLHEADRDRRLVARGGPNHNFDQHNVLANQIRDQIGQLSTPDLRSVLIRMVVTSLNGEMWARCERSTSDDSEAAETPPAACGRTNPHMPHAFGEMLDEECAGIPSPCACPPADGPRTMPDPLCPRHQRRKVRGPTFDERLDVRRRIDQWAEHRPSSLGDGLGYGPCVGCGELWPCTASRGERCTCPRHGAVM